MVNIVQVNDRCKEGIRYESHCFYRRTINPAGRGKLGQKAIFPLRIQLHPGTGLRKREVFYSNGVKFGDPGVKFGSAALDYGKPIGE